MIIEGSVLLPWWGNGGHEKIVEDSWDWYVLENCNADVHSFLNNLFDWMKKEYKYFFAFSAVQSKTERCKPISDSQPLEMIFFCPNPRVLW